ncbi:hypothetical protein GCM10027275_27250 [Rhabdobacter roseus]|uniref:histidine kinase n=1 Tax=Rhabdobacter roseus TaxID=1655419 RepID=A0A840TM47_9BACT|nr:7TM-DISM domain-containing protein [Rhabdobacter roseus]MBB5284671.1 signal transduction histidine kinase [Rhabdobacter roseus]
MIRKLVLLLGVVVLLMLGLLTYHQSSIRQIAIQPVPIYHWEDTTGLASAREARQVGRFTRVQEKRFNTGYTESIHWFHLRIKASKEPVELSFEIRNHAIDQVELFVLKNNSLRSLGQTGSRFPFVQRPSPTKSFVYLLNVEVGQQADYYLRLDKRYENLATELTLWRTSDFEDKEQREYFLWGLFFGVAGLVIFLAFLFFITTRDRVYGWFGLYLLGLTLRQLADTGLGFQFVWPGLPVFNHPDAVIEALWLYVPAMLQFQQHFLQLRTAAPWVFRLSQVLKYAFCLALLLLVVGQLTGLLTAYTGAYRLVTMTHTLLANVVFILFIFITLVGLRSQDSVKRLYAVGFGIQIIGQLFIFIQNLMRYRVDGVFFVDAYLIVMVNFFIDLVVFTYLLAYRYRRSLDEQRRLKISLAQAQQQTNAAIIDVLEAERQQVGYLLQSDVGGRLHQTRSLLTGLASAPLLVEAVKLIDKTDDCLDQILRDSPPPDLLRKGLAVALAELVQQRNETGSIRLQFRHDTDGPLADLSDAQTRQLYRIANELTNNLIKHAQATEGCVVLSQLAAGWELMVSDNGRGFDPSQAGSEGGIGLKNLFARAQTLGATVQLVSGKEGTTIRVQG